MQVHVYIMCMCGCGGGGGMEGGRRDKECVHVIVHVIF